MMMMMIMVTTTKDYDSEVDSRGYDGVDAEHDDFDVHGHGNGGVIIAVVWKNKEYRSQGSGYHANSGKVEIKLLHKERFLITHICIYYNRVG